MERSTIDVTEIFYSLKGEGPKTGRPMLFIRFAGCDLCTTDPKAPLNRKSQASKLCYNFDGEPFYCDTEFSSQFSYTVQELVDIVRSHETAYQRFDYVVLTGGEPLRPCNIDFLLDFEEALYRATEKIFYIETSGLYELPNFSYSHFISCSPKRGYLSSVVSKAHEIRFLVTAHTKFTSITDFLEKEKRSIVCNRPAIRFSPYAPGDGPSSSALANCIAIVKRDPSWALNLQLHKILGID